MSNTNYSTNESFARDLDDDDPLSWCRDNFFYPIDKIYVDGNSLGLMCRRSGESLSRVLNEWRQLGIGGWENAKPRWLDVGERLGGRMAPLVGAATGTVVATGTTTVNLHALVSTFYRPDTDRCVLLTDDVTFPTDVYALRSQVERRGLDVDRSLRFVPVDDRGFIDEDGVIDAMSDDVALVVLSSVIYSTGQLVDVPRLTHAAHERGIVIGWDCSHSVGVLPHTLDEWGVDFAFWCGYKYLNGGPGCPAFLYVNERHSSLCTAMPGWWGFEKSRQFDMRPHFEPATGAGGWQISTPSIIAAAPLEVSLGVTAKAGIDRIRAKSLDMTGYLMFLIDAELAPLGFGVATPRDPDRRGGHVSLTHPKKAREVFDALAEHGVIADFRPPNIIRIAPVPLYNTYNELWQLVTRVRYIARNM